MTMTILFPKQNYVHFLRNLRIDRDFNHMYSLAGQIRKAPKIGGYLINAAMLMFGVRAARVLAGPCSAITACLLSLGIAPPW